MDNELRESMSSYSEDKTIFYTVLTLERIEEAIRILEKTFYDEEPLCSSYRITSNPTAVKELNHLCRLIAQDGFSIIAIDVETNKIIGVSFNKIQSKNQPGQENFFEEFTRVHCTTEESIVLMNSMAQSDDEANVFEIYNVTKLMEITFLTVLTEYRNKKIGFNLVKHDLELLNKFAKRQNGPVLATSMLTSKFSTNIFLALGFDVVTTISFEKFIFKGVKSSEKINPIHEVVSMVAKQAVID